MCTLAPLRKIALLAEYLPAVTARTVQADQSAAVGTA